MSILNIINEANQFYLFIANTAFHFGADAFGACVCATKSLVTNPHGKKHLTPRSQRPLS